jgi:hypothetical protein
VLTLCCVNGNAGMRVHRRKRSKFLGWQQQWTEWTWWTEWTRWAQWECGRELSVERLWVPYRSAARTFALAISSSRFLGGAFVSSERNNRVETCATLSTAAKNAASFIFDGLEKPLIFLTNCSEAARTSSSVTGGSKLNSGLIFLHMISVNLSRDHIGAIKPSPQKAAALTPRF